MKERKYLKNFVFVVEGAVWVGHSNI